MVKKKHLTVDGELLSYLQRRAMRNRSSIEATLDHVIREAMRFDDLVTKMQERDEVRPFRH